MGISESYVDYQIKPSFLHKISLERIIWAAAAIIVLYLVAGPVFVLIFSSFRDTADKLPMEATSFTISNYIHVFTSSYTYKMLLNTIIYAAGSLLISFLITIGFAWVIERTDIPGRPFFLMGILAPMAFPGVVSAMSWMILANPSNGLFNLLLRCIFGSTENGPLNIYSMTGMIIVTTTMMVPSMYLMVSGTFSRLDPALEEASDISGVKPFRTFLKICMPLLRPSLLAAGIYYFIISIEVFEIPSLLGSPKGLFVFSTALYSAVETTDGLPDYGLASVYGAFGFIVGTILIYLYGRSIKNREQFTVVTGKAYRPRLLHLGRWRPLISCAMWIYISFSLIIPVLTLIYASLLPYYTNPSIDVLKQVSLINYIKIFQTPAIVESVINTGIVAFITPTLVVLLALVISWRSIRYKSFITSVPDQVSFLILGTPSVVIGLALIILYLVVPLPIYGTIWIIIIAFVTRYISYATRTMSGAFIQVHRELEEASYISGAVWLKTMIHIVLPIVWPSTIRCWLWVCVQSVREVTLALMLVGIGNATIAVRLWMMVISSKGDISFACALAVLIIIVLLTMTFFIARSTIFISEAEKAR